MQCPCFCTFLFALKKYATQIAGEELIITKQLLKDLIAQFVIINFFRPRQFKYSHVQLAQDGGSLIFKRLSSCWVMVGGISPIFILLIASLATLPALAVSVKPLMPLIPGMVG